MSDAPYHDRKPYHLATLINQRGGVSALCYAKPKAIDLKRACWTTDETAVTCRKCLMVLGNGDSK